MGDGSRRPSRANRWVLAVLGALLLLGGLAGLAVGFGLFGTGPAENEVLGAAAVDQLAQPWVLVVLAVLAVLAALLALRWLMAQMGTDFVSRLRVDTETKEGVMEMPASALCRVLEEDVVEYPGVRRARARLTGSSREPRMRLDLTLEEDADAAQVWQHSRDEGLARLREALELDRLPAVIRMSMAAPQRKQRRELV